MELIKVRIGDFVKQLKQTCSISKLTEYDISGVNKEKEFFEPSKQVGEDTSKYKNVPPDHFACNLMHVGRDRLLPIALNHTEKTKVVSPAYTVFSIVSDSPLLKEYFMIMLKSQERDRHFWFQADSSVRDGMTWEDFCSLIVEVPPIEIQQKYVNIYKAMVDNQKTYENGLDDLKLACEAFIDKLKKEEETCKIGDYISRLDKRNDEQKFNLNNVRGISTDKQFIETKANMNGVSLKSYKVVPPLHFAYVADTSRRGNKISLSLNNSNTPYIVSSISTVFRVEQQKIIPEYLNLFLSRSEFDRYSRYNSWGSARETFDWCEMCDVKIPLPSLEIQRSIVNIFNAYNDRKRINEQLKEQIKNICPILIKGSIEEARKA